MPLKPELRLSWLDRWSQPPARFLVSCLSRPLNRHPQYLFEQDLVLASQVPPSFWHCSWACLSLPPAKAGTVKASTRVTANIDLNTFMMFLLAQTVLPLPQPPLGGPPSLSSLMPAPWLLL